MTAEVTPTERASMFRFTFPESDSSAVVIDAFAEGSMVQIIPSERKVIGYCRNNHGGVPENFHNYFVIIFDRDFDLIHTGHGGHPKHDWLRRVIMRWQSLDSAPEGGEVVTEGGVIIHQSPNRLCSTLNVRRPD